MGGLRRVVSAKVNDFSVHPDDCAPPPRLAAEINALVSGSVVSRTASIRVVLRRGRPPQIAPPVVAGISIAVIDRRPAPPAHHVEPGQLMCAVQAPVDADASITFL